MGVAQVKDVKDSNVKRDHGTTHTFECNTGYAPKYGVQTEMKRKCTNGVFDPTFQAKPILCFKTCKVEKANGISTYKDKANTIHSLPKVFAHDEPISTTCEKDYFDINGLSVYTGKCQDGNVSPQPHKCHKECKTIDAVSNANTGLVTSLKHGKSVTYVCNNGWKQNAGSKMTRQCQDGVMDKSTIICFEQCKATNVLGTQPALFKISFFGHFAPFVPPSCAYHLPHYA